MHFFFQQFWCRKWARSTIAAGRRIAKRWSCSTKSSTTSRIISVPIWFWLWNVTEVNVEKLQHCKRKVRPQRFNISKRKEEKPNNLYICIDFRPKRCEIEIEKDNFNKNSFFWFHFDSHVLLTHQRFSIHDESYIQYVLKKTLFPLCKQNNFP